MEHATRDDSCATLPRGRGFEPASTGGRLLVVTAAMLCLTSASMTLLQHVTASSVVRGIAGMVAPPGAGGVAGLLFGGLGLVAMAKGSRPLHRLACIGMGLGVALALMSAVGFTSEGLAEWLRPFALPSAGALLANALACAALGMAALRSPSRRQLILACSLSLGVIGLALTAMLSTLTGVDGTYTRGHLTAMPSLYALELSVFATALLRHTSARARHTACSERIILAPAVGLLSACFAIAAWQGLLARERAYFQQATETELSYLDSSIGDALLDTAQDASYMAALLAPGQDPPGAAPGWQAKAERILRQDPRILGLNWIDPVAATVHAIESDRWDIDDAQRMAFLRGLAPPLVPPLMPSGPAATPCINTPGPTPTSFTTLAPVPGGRAADGFLAVTFDAARIMGDIVSKRSLAFSVGLYDEDTVLFERSGTLIRAVDEFALEQRIDMNGLSWRLRLMPTPALAASTRSVIPEVVLAVGALVSLLLVLTVWYAQTARHRTLQARDSEERLRAVLNATADAIVAFDSSGAIRVVNTSAEALFRGDAGQLTGQDIDVLAAGDSIRHGDERSGQAGTRPPARSQTETLITARRCDGTTFPGALRVRTTSPGQGAATGWSIAVIQDMTQRLEAERLLRDANEELTRSHRELKESQLHLIQAAKLESVGRLAAGVAHEVKNPLATILLGLDYLSDEGLTGEAGLEAVVMSMKESVIRADAVIRGLLDFASPREIELAPGDIHETLDLSLLLVRGDLLRSHIDVETHYDDALPPVLLDSQKLSQVLVNILVNACHAMPQGGAIHVTTSLTGDGAAPTGRQVVVQIDDSGTGIPEDVLGKIFDPFFTTKPTGVGTGLGLSVSKKIVDLHEGTLAFTNRPEGGVRVLLTLPVPHRKEPSCPSLASSSSTTKSA